MAQKIKIKLPKQMIQALYSCLHDVFTFHEATSNHERLLFELMGELFDTLAKMLNNAEQKKYTLVLNSAQALAFMQFFSMVPLVAGSLEAETVRRVMGDIDYASKKPKALPHGYDL